MFKISPIARLLVVGIVAVILAGLYLAKDSSSEIIIKNQGVTNEPLLVYGEKYKQNFENDDVLRYSPIPYTFSHKMLMNYMWKNPGQVEMKYRVWLCSLVIFSILSYYLFFYYLSKSFLWSLALSVAVVVGYYENSWCFSFMGITGSDSLIGRSNYTAILPLYLLLYLKTLRRNGNPLLFFFLLGAGVNLYPAIAIVSAIIYYIVMAIQKQSSMKIADYFLPMLAFFLPAVLFVIYSFRDIAAFDAAHLSDPRYYQLLDRMRSLLHNDSDSSIPSRLFTDSQGNLPNLLRQFILYPPFVILVGFAVRAIQRYRFEEADSESSKDCFTLVQLFAGTIGIIFVGWMMKAFNLELPSVLSRLPPLQYVGNLLIVVGYGIVASQYDKIASDIVVKQRWIWISFFTALGVLVAGHYYSPTQRFFVDAAYWVSVNAIILWGLLKRYHCVPSGYFLMIIVLAIASGFSSSYDEIAVPLQAPFKYLSRLLPVIFSAAFLTLMVGSLQKSRENWTTYALLFVAPFSWALPLRVHDNVAAFLKTDSAKQLDAELSDFKKMTAWVRENTPVTARFMINNSIDGLGLVSAFKYLAIRSTPIVDGGDRYYYGELGSRYGMRNSDHYLKALHSKDDAAIYQLSREIFFDYFIVNSSNEPHFSSSCEKVYDGNYFDIYRVAMR